METSSTPAAAPTAPPAARLATAEGAELSGNSKAFPFVGRKSTRRQSITNPMVIAAQVARKEQASPKPVIGVCSMCTNKGDHQCETCDVGLCNFHRRVHVTMEGNEDHTVSKVGENLPSPRALDKETFALASAALESARSSPSTTRRALPSRRVPPPKLPSADRPESGHNAKDVARQAGDTAADERCTTPSDEHEESTKGNGKAKTKTKKKVKRPGSRSKTSRSSPAPGKDCNVPDRWESKSDAKSQSGDDAAAPPALVSEASQPADATVSKLVGAIVRSPKSAAAGAGGPAAPGLSPTATNPAAGGAGRGVSLTVDTNRVSGGPRSPSKLSPLSPTGRVSSGPARSPLAGSPLGSPTSPSRAPSRAEAVQRAMKGDGSSPVSGSPTGASSRVVLSPLIVRSLSGSRVIDSGVPRLHASLVKRRAGLWARVMTEAATSQLLLLESKLTPNSARVVAVTIDGTWKEPGKFTAPLSPSTLGSASSPLARTSSRKKYNPATSVTMTDCQMKVLRVSVEELAKKHPLLADLAAEQMEINARAREISDAFSTAGHQLSKKLMSHGLSHSQARRATNRLACLFAGSELYEDVLVGHNTSGSHGTTAMLIRVPDEILEDPTFVRNSRDPPPDLSLEAFNIATGDYENEVFSQAKLAAQAPQVQKTVLKRWKHWNRVNSKRAIAKARLGMSEGMYMKWRLETLDLPSLIAAVRVEGVGGELSDESHHDTVFLDSTCVDDRKLLQATSRGRSVIMSSVWDGDAKKLTVTSVATPEPGLEDMEGRCLDYFVVTITATQSSLLELSRSQPIVGARALCSNVSDWD